jgi:hypothetical protein
MQIRLTKDTMTPELRRLAAELGRPQTLLAAGAKQVQHDLIEHLKDLQSKGNVKGWPQRYFFAGRPTSVRKNVGLASLTDREAVITIADRRFVHHITGGPVYPGPDKEALAIPLTAEAAAVSGKGTLRESMPGLVVVKTKKGAYLAMPTAAAGKAVSLLRFLFKLLKSVTHHPHPADMPDVKKLALNARAAMLTAARRLLRAD